MDIDITALFSLSYGIYLLGAHDKDRPEQKGGCLVNTVFQLTAEPIRVGVSVAKENRTHEMIMSTGTVSVTVMDEGASTKLLGTFGYRSCKNWDKFDGVRWHEDLHGDPLIDENAVTHLSCKVSQIVDIQTHSLFICDVVDAVKISEDPAMTYNYYRTVKKGQSSKYAPTYVDPSKLAKPADKQG